MSDKGSFDAIDPSNIRKYFKELRSSETHETVFRDAITAGEFAHWYHIYKVKNENQRSAHSKLDVEMSETVSGATASQKHRAKKTET